MRLLIGRAQVLCLPRPWFRIGSRTVNRKTKTLHLLPVGSTKATFLCGRRLTSDSIQFEGTIFHDSWKCRQCDTSKPLRDIGSCVSCMEARAKASSSKERRSDDDGNR